MSKLIAQKVYIKQQLVDKTFYRMLGIDYRGFSPLPISKYLIEKKIIRRQHVEADI